MIKEARNEKNLKALVLRVNTPGGSAFASEIIREQVLAIKDRGIPIVVSSPDTPQATVFQELAKTMIESGQA